jgi:integrase
VHEVEEALSKSEGGYIDLEKFRHRDSAPALIAAELEHRRIYDCRHTFATWAIESGVQLVHLAAIMGTSVRQIEDTYARWLGRTDDQIRLALDTYDRDRGGAIAVADVDTDAAETVT